MRFVPISCVREGMVLGENLYNSDGELMLVRGKILTQKNVKSIKRLMYAGIYIEDEISEGISIVHIVSDQVRAKTLKQIRNLFIQCEKGSENIQDSLKSTKYQIDNIIDEIYENKNILVNMLDLKTFDDYTYNHSVNVAILSIALGVSLEMNKQELSDLGFSALLHDIGKVFISKDVLNKSSPLTEAEYEEIKSHSLLGCNHIRKGYIVSEESLNGILEHHEKYGGGGYPCNIKGEQISRSGRIIATADVYDALTTERPYRKAILPSDAVEYIMASIMIQFDPVVVNAFVRKIAPYPAGTCVELSNGLTAIVTENSEEACLRPKVRVYKDGNEKVEPYEIDLAERDFLNVVITEIV
jgi:HD-GYP domain-containing protein (c-di-GMP phosphodiesterase class II)